MQKETGYIIQINEFRAHQYIITVLGEEKIQSFFYRHKAGKNTKFQLEIGKKIEFIPPIPSNSRATLDTLSCLNTAQIIAFSLSKKLLLLVIADFLRQFFRSNALYSEDKTFGFYALLDRALADLEKTQTIQNFLIHFLVQILQELGIAPFPDTETIPLFFCTQTGHFLDQNTGKSTCWNNQKTSLFYYFLTEQSLDKKLNHPISAFLRWEFVDDLLQYIELHQNVHFSLKSIETIKSVFV